MAQLEGDEANPVFEQRERSNTQFALDARQDAASLVGQRIDVA